MAKQRKVIVTAAVTGGIHTPTMTPYLPKGPDEVARDAIDAANAGASIVHIHARRDVTGQPTADFDSFEQILTKVKKASNVVIGITTGGAQGMTVEERFAVIDRFKPEMASANGGSINFCLSKLADGPGMDAPKFDWEVPFLKGTYDNVFKNTFKDMEFPSVSRLFLSKQPIPQIIVKYDCGSRQEEPSDCERKAYLTENIKRHIGVIPDAKTEPEV